MKATATITKEEMVNGKIIEVEFENSWFIYLLVSKENGGYLLVDITHASGGHQNVPMMKLNTLEKKDLKVSFETYGWLVTQPKRLNATVDVISKLEL